MSGEDSERVIRRSARLAARHTRLAQRIIDVFAADARQGAVLLLEDGRRELEEVGHFFEPACTRPFCARALTVLQNVTPQLIQQVEATA